VLGLVDRSLVQFDPDGGRYQLLETLRQYGAERLAEAGETEEVAERHARFFLGLAAGQADALSGPGYPQARAVLTAELDNLRAAAEWCTEHERWRDLQDLCRHTLVFVFVSRPESASWYQHLLADDPELEARDRVDVLGELAHLAGIYFGDWTTGEAMALEIDELATAQGLAPSPWAGMARAMLALYEGRYEETLRFPQAASQAAAARNDRLAVVVAAGLFAHGLAGVGRIDEARSAAAEALHRAEGMGSPGVTAMGAITVASSYFMTAADPDFAAALAVLNEHAKDLAGGDLTTMWSHLFRGYCLLCLGEPGAYEHLDWRTASTCRWAWRTRSGAWRRSARQRVTSTTRRVSSATQKPALLSLIT
jgi:hypothetical protein